MPAIAKSRPPGEVLEGEELYAANQRDLERLRSSSSLARWGEW